MRTHVVHYPNSLRFPGRGVICGTKSYTVVCSSISDATCLRCIDLGPECERANFRAQAKRRRKKLGSK